MPLLFYIILHKPTGQWLGHSKQKNKTAASLTMTKPPRLFTTKVAAVNALRWWLEGEWHYYYSSGGYYDQPDEGFECKKVNRPLIEEMLITTANITLHRKASK